MAVQLLTPCTHTSVYIQVYTCTYKCIHTSVYTQEYAYKCITYIYNQSLQVQSVVPLISDSEVV